MKYTVFGAGKMGSAVAYDLARDHPDDRIILADIDRDRAARAAQAIGSNVHPLGLDVDDDHALAAALEGSSVAVGAVSYTVNGRLTKAAIAAGVHLCDMGGNDDIVRQQLALDAGARERNIAVVPNCGLAPGLINILALHGARRFDQLDSIHLRVGGLPQHPRPPLNYQIVFSTEGLINEYTEKASIIRDGRRMSVESMTGLEEIRFPEPFGTMEAFYTSGGASMLDELLEGKVRELDYKTIRYPGHCEKFKMLLDLGFAASEPMLLGGSVKTSRDLFTDLLGKKLDYGDTDVVLGRCSITGTLRGARQLLAYEFIDYYDEQAGLSAMMRGTAFPTAIIARLLAEGTLNARGVVLPEVCVPGEIMIKELAGRNFIITTTIRETGS